MRKLLSILTVATCLVQCKSPVSKPAAVAAGPVFSMPFDRGNWNDDLTALERFISEAYPNLDATYVYGVKLDRLDQETRAKLAKANSNAEAFTALNEFVAQFHDGHFKLKAGQDKPVPDFNGQDRVGALTRATSGSEACRKLMGSSYRNFDFLFPMPSSLGFERKNEGISFPTAILNNGGRKVGFLRISSFGQGNYPDLCAEEWDQYRTGFASCEGECQEKFVYDVMPNRLLTELEKAVERLKTEKISALVLDVTSNGGGTDWVGAVMRMLTSRPILCGQFAFIKHPHWTKHFQDEIDDLNKQVAMSTDKKTKRTLEKRLKQSKADLALTKETCDRSAIWSKNGEAACSLLVKRPVPECMPHEKFKFNRGIYSGPLFVLTDNGTASAAEDVVARYKESKLAKILGEKTHGSGCGYVDGQIPFELPHSKISVVMPNCARYSRKGVNEVLGIDPDISLPEHDLRSEAYTKILIEYLGLAVN
jgi:hypothetical protein